MSDEKKEDQKEKTTEKSRIIGVPTQKTFIFRGSQSEKEIDSVINPWLKQQAIGGQTPLLVKMEISRSFFRQRIIYVYMYNAPFEIKK